TERTREAITPAPEIPLPPGAVVTPDPARTEDRIPPQAPAGEPAEPAPAVEAAPRVEPTEELERAGRDIAERVRSILKRAEATIIGDADPQPAAPPPSPPEAPQPAPQSRHADNENVREGLPDFDAPAERALQEDRSRRLIDDTETFDPGRPAEDLFAEGERKARIV